MIEFEKYIVRKFDGFFSKVKEHWKKSYSQSLQNQSQIKNTDKAIFISNNIDIKEAVAKMMD